MDLATIEPGLLAWLSTLTGTALALCVKANAARPVVPGPLGGRAPLFPGQSA